MRNRKSYATLAAATLAAAPLAGKAATITFSYEPTVTYGTNAAITLGTGTATITGNGVTIPAGDFFKFNVDVLVTGNPNSEASGPYNAVVPQPANLGLTGFGFDITDSAPTNVVPRAVGGNAVVTVTGNGNAYDISAKGAANTSTGEVGTSLAPLSGGFLAGNAAASNPATLYRITLGAGTAQPIFTGLVYQALTGSKAIITPTLTSGSVAYAIVGSAGTSSTPPTYLGHQATGADVINALPALTVNGGGVTTTPTHNIINLTSATQAGGNYGVQLTSGAGANQATFAPNTPVAGTINVTKGGANSYTPGFANGVSGATAGTGAITDFTAISGFAAGDQEIYALKLLVGSSAPTTTQINSIVADIGGQSATDGVSTVASLLGSPSGLAGQIASLFPGYDLMLTVSPGTTTPFLGFDFSQETNVAGVVVTNIAAVPEPASAAILLIGSSLLLGRRKRNALMA